MRLLAIETSGLRCGAAVIEDGQLKAWLESEQGLTHSRRLMPLVQALLDSQGLKAKDMDLLALSVGPGSFTGLRIGAATCQGIAAASGARVIEVPTLASLAAPWQPLGLPVLSLIDARHARCYAALYEDFGVGLPESAIEPGVYSLEEIGQLLTQRAHETIILTGDGQHYATEGGYAPRLAAGRTLRLSAVTQSSAVDVARLAWSAWLADPALALDAANVRPQYLNRTAAEKNLGIEVD